MDTAAPPSKRRTKDEIRQAALDLFSKRGFADVSVRDIAGLVGIKESTIYSHYVNKDAILEDILGLFERGFGRECFIEDTIEHELDGTDPVTFLERHLVHLRNKITPDVQQAWIVVYMEQFRNERARDFVLNQIIALPAAYYAKAFRLMAARGLLVDSVDPVRLAEEYNYGLFSMSLERMLRQADGEAATEIVAKMLAHIRFICEPVTR